MILTVTANPSVDISYKLNSFATDTVNRVTDVSKSAGGKGLNVSRVLTQLGEKAGAAGFLGGSLGEFIRSELKRLEIQDYFVGIAGDTRNCIAIIHEGKQTEVLESGPVIAEKEAAVFMRTFEEYIQGVDVLTISGSLPKGLNADFYQKLIKAANNNGKPVLLDTKGELLSETLKSDTKPFLIKPNIEEIADMTGKKFANLDEVKQELTDALFSEIPWLVVTLGADGALVKHEDNLYQVKIPKVKAVNPVGSGDSVIAGFAAGIVRDLPDEELIKFGLSMGVLNAMEEKTGFINVENLDWCMDNMQIERILKA